MHKIEKLTRKTEALKFLSRLRGVAKMECYLGNMSDRLEVRAINNIVFEVKKKFEISSAVQKTLGNPVRKIEAFGFQTYSGACSGGNGPS